MWTVKADCIALKARLNCRNHFIMISLQNALMNSFKGQILNCQNHHHFQIFNFSKELTQKSSKSKLQDDFKSEPLLFSIFCHIFYWTMSLHHFIVIFSRNTDSLINGFAAQRRIIIKQSFTSSSGKFYPANVKNVLVKKIWRNVMSDYPGVQLKSLIIPRTRKA